MMASKPLVSILGLLAFFIVSGHVDARVFTNWLGQLDGFLKEQNGNALQDCFLAAFPPVLQEDGQPGEAEHQPAHKIMDIVARHRATVGNLDDAEARKTALENYRNDQEAQGIRNFLLLIGMLLWHNEERELPSKSKPSKTQKSHQTFWHEKMRMMEVGMAEWESAMPFKNPSLPGKRAKSPEEKMAKAQKKLTEARQKFHVAKDNLLNFHDKFQENMQQIEIDHKSYSEEHKFNVLLKECVGPHLAIQHLNKEIADNRPPAIEV